MKLTKQQKKNIVKNRLQGVVGEARKKAFREMKSDIEAYADEKSKDIYEQLVVSCMKVLRDDLGFGKKRIASFMKSLHDQIICINQKYVSVNDIYDMIASETKFDLNTFVQELYLNKK